MELEQLVLLEVLLVVPVVPVVPVVQTTEDLPVALVVVMVETDLCGPIQ